MNLSTPLRSKQEYFPFDSIMITEDSIDAYLDNPNFDVLDMIEQVKICSIFYDLDFFLLFFYLSMMCL